MTYSSCLHDQQDLCWGNTSRDTSEESQESQKVYILKMTQSARVCINEPSNKSNETQPILNEGSKDGYKFRSK